MPSFQAHHHLQLLAHCWHYHPAETWNETTALDSTTSGTATYSGAARRKPSRTGDTGCLDVATTIGMGQGVLMSELYGSSKASKRWMRSNLRVLQFAVGPRVECCQQCCTRQAMLRPLDLAGTKMDAFSKARHADVDTKRCIAFSVALAQIKSQTVDNTQKFRLHSLTGELGLIGICQS